MVYGLAINSDFLKVGGLLTVLIYLIAITLVPRIWPVTKPSPPAAVPAQGAMRLN
jgi:hypothetical protein